MQKNHFKKKRGGGGGGGGGMTAVTHCWEFVHMEI